MGYWKRFDGVSTRGRAGGGGSGGMGDVDIEFAGVDELMKILEQLPVKFGAKVTKALLRKGANEFKKDLRKNTPARLKVLSKIIKTKAGRGGSLSVSAGFFANVATVTNKSGQEWDPYYLMYWSNYGTLSNRYSGHNFEKPRRPVSSGWKGGIRPKLFVEKSWESSKDRAEDAIEKNFKSEAVKVIKKHAVK